ncbi:MAG TPA: hypothetical protein VL332_09190 [Candidatus Saccharimonadaceae bacterium]|nr:hypothetical protein [Candidatus Saccharimonadaceae bacterium]
MSAAPLLAISVAVGAADTIGPAGHFIRSLPPGAGPIMGPGFVEKWHEYFMMTGTAAVTLAGLLFVALSFNLDALLHDTKAHLLAYARLTLLAFMGALILSLFMLVPGWHGRALGAELMAGSGALTIFSGALLINARRAGHARARAGSLGRRSIVMVLCFIGISLVGYSIFMSNDEAGMYWLVSLFAMLLASATNSAWDLLVEVGKLKKADEAKRTRE